MRFQPRAVRALAAAGLRSYAEAPGAAAALFAFYLLLGYLFASPLFASGEASLKPLLEFGPLLQTALVAALTMGLLAGDLRAGTFETLASFPLEDCDLVLGRWLGFALFHTGATAALFVVLVAVRALAAPAAGLDWGASFGVLAALWANGLALGALGVFASSLGKSLIGAFTAAFALGFALLSAGRLAVFAGPSLGRALEWLGAETHLLSMGRGVLDTRDAAYFASLVALFLYLAAARLEARRARLGLSRAFSAAGALIALAAVAAVNGVAAVAWTRLDLSAERSYSLSKGTKQVLSQLEEPLTVRVYFTRDLPPPYGATRRYLLDLLSEYRAAARGKLNFGESEDEKEATGAGIAPIGLNIVQRGVFEARQAYMGAALLYKDRKEVLPVVTSPEDLEYELTRRIKRLVSPEKKTVGFVAGHGEREPGDPQMAPFYEVVREQMRLSTAKLDQPIPEGVDALWILAPKTPFTAAELDVLRRWVARGKALGLAISARAVDFDKMQAKPADLGLSALLAEWGLSMSKELVVDAQADRIELQSRVGPYLAARVQDYPYIPVATKLDREHPVTRGLTAVPFPFVHALRLDSPPPGIKLTPLAESSPRSWLRSGSDVGPGATIEELASGPRGPFALAAAVEGKGRVVVIATGHQLEPRFANRRASLDFILNALEWSYQDEALLGVRARGPAFRPLRPVPDARSRALIQAALAGALPLATGAFALLMRGVRARRRRENALRFA